MLLPTRLSKAILMCYTFQHPMAELVHTLIGGTFTLLEKFKHFFHPCIFCLISGLRSHPFEAFFQGLTRTLQKAVTRLKKGRKKD